MAEYIEREKAYELARTSELYSDFRRSMADLTSLKELLEDTPTADVVEVVRCMHCIHFKASVIKENYCDLHSSTWDKFYVRVDNFCSYGKRKEVANNG